MKRVCNGCLQAKKIINEKEGYCEYCEKTRNIQTKDILNDLNINLEAFKQLTEIERKLEIELMQKYNGEAISLAYLKKIQKVRKEKNNG